MALTAMAVWDMLNTLGEEDYKTAISYIQFLSDSRKKERAKNQQRLWIRFNPSLEMIKGGILKKKCYRIWQTLEGNV